MKTLIPLVLATLTIVLTSACSDNSADNSSDATTTDIAADSPALVGKSCLQDYVFEPCSLFSLEEMASVTQLPADQARLKEPRPSKNPTYMACGVKWDSERTLTVKTSSRSIEVPVNDSVVIGAFSILDPERIKEPFIDHFNSMFNTPTEEEQQKFDESFEQALEGESQLTKDVGKGFAALAQLVEYTKIEGIGDSASWETNPKTSDGTLHVLHKNLTFRLVVNLRDDSEYNLEMAKKIAAPIVAKCD